MATVQPVPKGFHTITAQVVVKDAAKAIDFYKKAFGAEEVNRMPGPNGKIWHADLRIGDSHLFLADESLSSNKLAASPGGSPITIQLNVADCDALFQRATGSGAKVAMPLEDMFWGDRYGQVTDPFGITWAISTHKKDLSPSELANASAKAAKEIGRANA